MKGSTQMIVVQMKWLKSSNPKNLISAQVKEQVPQAEWPSVAKQMVAPR